MSQQETYKNDLIKISESLKLTLSETAAYVLRNVHDFSIGKGDPDDAGFLRYCEIMVISDGVKPRDLG